jgi:hypothetical protein
LLLKAHLLVVLFLFRQGRYAGFFIDSSLGSQFRAQGFVQAQGTVLDGHAKA